MTRIDSWKGRTVDDSRSFWRKCSACKKPIPFGASYYVCSVSTCNRERTGYVFCSVACWDTHVPVMRHRKAWAEERHAPPRQEAAARARAATVQEGDDKKAARRLRVRPARSGQGGEPARARGRGGRPDEILVVASKIRDYIRARADMNTSATVFEVLSDRLRDLCDHAIDVARADGRKTVLDRDFDRTVD